MFYIIGPPATWLNTAFASLLENLSVSGTVVLSLVLGAMMAFDMGGPVNKAAYAFALAASDNNNWLPMAAVMVGGMVPPFGDCICHAGLKGKIH